MGEVTPRFKEPRDDTPKRRKPLKRTGFKRRPDSPSKRPQRSKGLNTRGKSPKAVLGAAWDAGFQMAVLARDRFSCRVCGLWATGGAHHLVRRSIREWRWNTANGIALCALHHGQAEEYKLEGWPDVKIPASSAEQFMANGGQAQLPGAWEGGGEDFDVAETYPTKAEVDHYVRKIRHRWMLDD